MKNCVRVITNTWEIWGKKPLSLCPLVSSSKILLWPLWSRSCVLAFYIIWKQSSCIQALSGVFLGKIRTASWKRKAELGTGVRAPHRCLPGSGSVYVSAVPLRFPSRSASSPPVSKPPVCGEDLQSVFTYASLANRLGDVLILLVWLLKTDRSIKQQWLPLPDGYTSCNISVMVMD